MIKPGWKTTEFWLSFATMVIGAFVASGFLPTDHIAMKVAGFVLTALASLGYSVSRGIAKKEPRTIEPQTLKLPDWTKN